MSEREYHRLVAAWLDDNFGVVEHEPRLDSGRIPDFIAHTPFDSYVLEVEDSAESLYTGLGQARVYAHETGYTPVVVFPADDDPPTADYDPILVVTV